MYFGFVPVIYTADINDMGTSICLRNGCINIKKGMWIDEGKCKVGSIHLTWRWCSSPTRRTHYPGTQGQCNIRVSIFYFPQVSPSIHFSTVPKETLKDRMGMCTDCPHRDSNTSPVDLWLGTKNCTMEMGWIDKNIANWISGHWIRGYSNKIIEITNGVDEHIISW